jgi:general secretion pathway protein D
MRSFAFRFFLLGSLTLVLPVSDLFAQNQAAPEIKTSADSDEIEADAKSEINIKNADLVAVIRIFGKKTKRNYILDERVKGKVSIYLPGRVPEADAVRILDSILELKGFTSVRIGENLWKVIPSNEAKQTTIPTLLDDPEGVGSPTVVTRLVQLQYVMADEIKQLLTPLISASGILNAYTGTNSLLIVDTEENIVRLNKIIQSFDIPFSGQEMTIIPIKHAEAADVADKINQILFEKSESGSGATSDFNSAKQSAIKNVIVKGDQTTQVEIPTTVTVGGRAKEPKIIADERTNSLLVLADEETTAKIQALTAQLDSKLDLSGNKFYVYRCQHANAEDLAEVLSTLAGGGGAPASKSTGFFGQENDTSSLGSRESDNRSTRTNNRNASQTRDPGRQRNEGNRQTASPTNVSFGEDISITAEPATNSLVIMASKPDYQRLLELVKQLDIKRRQVLVEALLLEVAVDNRTSLSTEFITSTGGSDGGVMAVNNLGNLTGLLSDPTKLSDFSVAAASAGSLKLPGGFTVPSQTILMSAAAKNSNVNVLSSPNILATDNEDAEIVVGQNVPFLASTASDQQNLNNTFNQIERQDVGITLRITPQISSSDFVTLKIFTEVSNVVEESSGSELGPTTTLRTSETTVITKNNQMIVTGGLMLDNVEKSDAGVPFLKDIPVLGYLFRSDLERQRRTNLLIFITPRIINDQFDARDNSLNHRDEFTEEVGPTDPNRDKYLYNKDLDSVAESTRYDGPKPGTILPPENMLEASERRKLPPLRFKLNQDSLGNSADVNGNGDSQIILKLAQELPNDQTLGELPFTLTPNGETGIQLNHEQAENLGLLNSSGTLNYKIGKETLKFKVAKVIDSQEMAAQYEAKGVNWYQLSAHEILNIGQGPWTK